MRYWIPITAIAVVAVALWFTQLEKQPNLAQSPSNEPVQELKIYVPESDLTEDIEVTDSASSANSQIITATEPTKAPESISDNVTQVTMVESLHAWEVAQEPMLDEEYYRIVEILNSNPDFLMAVIAEFQGESDLRRLAKLAELLGEVENPEITTTAINMLASGNASSKKAAFKLLGNIQHRDINAQQAILQSISSSTNAVMLVSALNALSVADRSIAINRRTDITNRITPLIQHEDTDVRRHGYITLFRWAADMEQLLPRLTTGLRDSDEQIRRITALSFAEFPQADEQIKLELFTMLNNPAESDRNRNAAASALKRLDLAADEVAHINAVLKKIKGR